jgi:3-deoxy-manno-octulosonate cytidylyltransferase (CMP-KDO synthetase)
MAGAALEGVLPENVDITRCNSEELPWEDITPEERAVQARLMEIYAAMTDHLDRETGRLLAYMDQAGLLENTWIIYSNDNGPQGGGTRIRTVGDISRDDIDNSLDNLGQPDSWAFIHSGWADAISSPYRDSKATQYEGGIRVPAFAWHANYHAPGEIDPQYLSVMDIMPTLLDIAGKPMIQRVFEQASLSRAEAVVVATDDPRIEAVVRGFGGEVMMTDPGHASGTDRLAEVATGLQLSPQAIVVNVQGDEPLIPPAVIDQVAANLVTHPECSAATLAQPIASREEFLDPSAVKVVVDGEGRALYFSRAPIPWPRDHALLGEALPQGLPARRHIGIYAYRAQLLRQFVTWSEAPLEHIERLEQLRILHHGHPIHVDLCSHPVPPGVDTEEDLNRIRKFLLS